VHVHQKKACRSEIEIWIMHSMCTGHSEFSRNPSIEEFSSSAVRKGWIVRGNTSRVVIESEEQGTTSALL
jgi:hypothetical protein